MRQHLDVQGPLGEQSQTPRELITLRIEIPDGQARLQEASGASTQFQSGRSRRIASSQIAEGMRIEK